MNHVEVETTGAVGRYLLGEMNDAEQTDFEAHYFECGDCAQEIRVSTVFLANLQAVLREPYSLPEGGSHPKVMAMPRRRWAELTAIAAAIVLAAGLGYQNVVQIPQLRREIQQANAEDSPPTYYLAETRSAGDVIAVPRGAGHFALLLNQTPGRIYPYYDCELLDENGRVARSFRVPVSSNQEEWQLRLSAVGLNAQPYTLKVRGASSATSPGVSDVAVYHFRLEFR